MRCRNLPATRMVGASGLANCNATCRVEARTDGRWNGRTHVNLGKGVPCASLFLFGKGNFVIWGGGGLILKRFAQFCTFCWQHGAEEYILAIWVILIFGCQECELAGSWCADDGWDEDGWHDPVLLWPQRFWFYKCHWESHRHLLSRPSETQSFVGTVPPPWMWVLFVCFSMARCGVKDVGM